MKRLSRSLASLVAAGALIAFITFAAACAHAPSLEGRWDATVTVNGSVIPFRLDISGKGADLTGTLYNGDQKQTTTSARIENDKLTLEFGHYLTKIIATPKDGELEGKVQLGGDKDTAGNAFRAKRSAPAAASAANVPSIDGLWIIPHDSPKGEKAWRFIVKQNGAEVSAAILRVDGDTGALTGTYQDGRFVLGHFDGSRPLRLEVTQAADGSLELLQAGGGPRQGKLTAYRVDVARAKGLPEPADFNAHTTVRDPKEPFKFSFPNIDGKLVSNTDERYKNKVIIAVVTGTWCPNCHDEAQYLVQLYKKYHDKGLEIVALDFEEPEQRDELARAKAFIRKYGVEYQYLIAGAPAQMWEKVPQAVNLNTWPATFFIGRDGLVKKIHAGFAAPASGEFHRQLKEEFTSTVESLLAEQVASK
ncbi:MAG: TlpA family protein disulfide reductase [Blastocatellia bacterium]|nr:TlpA family protein disulfide reductase [Blastocatellia bacterium]